MSQTQLLTGNAGAAVSSEAFSCTGCERHREAQVGAQTHQLTDAKVGCRYRSEVQRLRNVFRSAVAGDVARLRDAVREYKENTSRLECQKQLLLKQVTPHLNLTPLPHNACCCTHVLSSCTVFVRFVTALPLSARSRHHYALPLMLVCISGVCPSYITMQRLRLDLCSASASTTASHPAAAAHQLLFREATGIHIHVAYLLISCSQKAVLHACTSSMPDEHGRLASEFRSVE